LFADRGDDRFTQALGRVPSRNAIFEPFFLLQEAVEGREQHRAGDFIGIDEIKGLASSQMNTSSLTRSGMLCSRSQSVQEY